MFNLPSFLIGGICGAIVATAFIIVILYYATKATYDDVQRLEDELW